MPAGGQPRTAPARLPDWLVRLPTQRRGISRTTTAIEYAANRQRPSEQKRTDRHLRKGTARLVYDILIAPPAGYLALVWLAVAGYANTIGREGVT